MYKLTARMLQHLENDLRRYHDLFDGGRCGGWELEELLVRAIRSDSTAGHHAQWREAGHDDLADIDVKVDGRDHYLQVKSGKFNKKQTLILSGNRLGRFKGNFEDITNYLNTSIANFLSVPYHQHEDATGRHHEYQVCYVSINHLHGLNSNQWVKVGAQWQQYNEFDVKFSIRLSMSWQIWWEIPRKLTDCTRILVIT